MAVLLLITLALSRLFAEATRSYTRATTTAERAGVLRAVMDLVTSDLEGLVVDRRLALHKEGNISDSNYDIICFTTVSGAKNYFEGDRTYEQVIYRVTNETDRGYSSYYLQRWTRAYGSSREVGIDPLGVQREWWNFRKYPGATLSYNYQRVAENIVRFDIWTCNVNGDNLADKAYAVWSKDDQVFNSTYEYPTMNHPSNTPPAYIDIYLQVASDDAMRKSSALLEGSKNVSGDEGDRLRAAAYAILYQDSMSLVSRVTPIMGIAERMHPLPY